MRIRKKIRSALFLVVILIGVQIMSYIIFSSNSLNQIILNPNLTKNIQNCDTAFVNDIHSQDCIVGNTWVPLDLKLRNNESFLKSKLSVHNIQFSPKNCNYEMKINEDDYCIFYWVHAKDYMYNKPFVIELNESLTIKHKLRASQSVFVWLFIKWIKIREYNYEDKL